MKKLISALALSAILLISFTASAQVGYEVVMPKISKIIEATGDNVSLRKDPSTTAPRLVSVCQDDSDDCFETWSNDPATKRRGLVISPITAYSGERFIVIDETPEWYAVLASHGNVAYISKRFTKEINLSPVTRNDIHRVSSFGYDWDQKAWFTPEKYADYVAVNVSGYEKDGIMFGRIIDGFLVLSHKFTPYFSSNNRAERLAISKDCQTIFYNPKLEFADHNNLDFTLLKESEINAILPYANVVAGKPSTYCEIVGLVNGKLCLLVEIYVDYLPTKFKTLRKF
ncbi:MAG: hypothetical protein ACI4AK_08050 [Lepagella sp.]